MLYMQSKADKGSRHTVHNTHNMKERDIVLCYGAKHILKRLGVTCEGDRRTHWQTCS